MTLSAHSASLKAAILTAIALLLLIPLTLLASLVSERTSQRDAAVQSVARGWGNKQWIGGPILAIPVTLPGEPTRTFDWYELPDRLDMGLRSSAISSLRGASRSQCSRRR